MKNKKMIIGSVVMSSLVLVGIVFSSAFASGSDPLKDFASCLTDSGLTMYGTDWCSHCSDQKELFGDAFSEIDFVNCDFHSDECSEAGIYGYPTWKKDENFLDKLGGLSFEELADASGCVAPIAESL